MNTNNIQLNIELCAEDRARLDGLTTRMDSIIHLLEKLGECDRCATILAQTAHEVQNTTETIGEVANPAPTPMEEPTPTTEQVEEEKPTEAEIEAESTVEPEPVEEPRTVELSDLQQKVIALVRAGKKDKVQSIVNEYADRVSNIPEDKRVEVWDRLTELEG